jgi:hypothetical protein
VADDVATKARPEKKYIPAREAYLSSSLSPAPRHPRLSPTFGAGTAFADSQDRSIEKAKSDRSI